MTNDEKKNVITLYVSRAFKISINKNHIVYVHKNNTNTISVSLSNNEILVFGGFQDNIATLKKIGYLL